MLAGLDGRLTGHLEDSTREALDSAPHAAAWAHHLIRRAGVSVRGFRRHAAPTTIGVAVRAISDACIPDPDAVLRQLLSDAIDDCREIVGDFLRPRRAGDSASPTAAAQEVAPAGA